MFSKKEKVEEIEVSIEDEATFVGEIEQDKISQFEQPTQEKTLNQGIEAQELDSEPEYENAEESDLDLSQEKKIEISYDFNGKEVEEALKIFQKETLFKKNMIYTIIFAVIFLVYVATVIKNPTQTMAYLLMAVCAVSVIFVWYFPINHIKKMSKAADADKESFKMNIYESCIQVGEENGSFILKFNKDITKIFETQNLFILCAGKERVFIVPKRCISNDSEVTDIFKNAMEENYSFQA